MQPRDPRPQSGAGDRDRRDANVTANEARLEELYQEHRQAVYRVCRRLLGDHADAEDAVQETFLRVRSHTAHLDDNPVRYLIVVARHVCYRELGRRGRREAAAARLGAPAEDAEQSAVARALLADLWREMPRGGRQVLARVVAGYTSGEIARSLGTSVTAVTSAVSRARSHARRLARDIGATGLALLGLRSLRRRLGGGAGSMHAAPVVFGLSVLTAAVITTAGPQVRIPAPAPAGGTAMQPGGPVANVPVQRSAPVGGGSTVRQLAPSPMPSTGAAAALPSTLPTPALTLAGPSETEVTAMSVSPRYGSDHTVAATGARPMCMEQAACPVFLLSGDGGRTWRHPLDVGLAYPYRAMFAPDYPSDPSIFVLTIAGLQRTVDGGRSFTTLVPGAYDAAFLPGSSPGTSRLLVVGTGPPAWSLVYDDANDALSQGPAWIAAHQPLWTRTTADGALLLVTRTAMSTSATAWAVGVGSAVQRCTAGGTCQAVLNLPADSGGNYFSLAAAGVGTSFLFYRGDQGFLSTDAGRSFHPVAMPMPNVTSAAVGDSGAILVIGTGAEPAFATEVMQSADAGRSWANLTADLTRTAPFLGVPALLPDGDVLVALGLHDAAGRYGIRCRNATRGAWGVAC